MATPQPSVQPEPGVSNVEALRESVRGRAENRPGVYRMVGGGGDVLYVGKSIRVRTRLLSYFRAQKGDKAFDLMRETASIEWDYIPNEFGALVREMRLIQRWRPPFNVQHKKKRPYAFVKLTREAAPRLVPVRDVVADGSRYYGPFPAVTRLRDAARGLSQVVGLRDCASATPIFFDDQLEMFAADRPPLCMRAELGTCPAPCAGGVSSRAYAERVETAGRFLDGTDDRPLAALDAAMHAAAARHEFEYAARLRDRRTALAEFRDQLEEFRGFVRDLSFVYKVPGDGGEDRIYVIRSGRVRAERSLPRGRAERTAADETVRTVFRGADPPVSALAPEEAAEILLVARWFRMNPAERGRTIKPERWLDPGSAPRKKRGRRGDRTAEGTVVLGPRAAWG
ncbi:MAG: nuclease [Gemmatimonadota bacterium]|nr:nuclease [Gemmatimonadota bacterium]